MKFKIKGCYLVYLAIGALFILINIKTKETLVEQSQSQYDCSQLGKSDCASSDTCMWKLNNTCQPANSEPSNNEPSNNEPSNNEPSNSEPANYN
jgi:hypothetical protein